MIIEFIESYRKVDGSDYQYNDNHGILVRCKDCKHRHDDGYCEAWGDSFHYWEDFDEVPEDMFCGHGERREKCGK